MKKEKIKMPITKCQDCFHLNIVWQIIKIKGDEVKHLDAYCPYYPKLNDGYIVECQKYKKIPCQEK